MSSREIIPILIVLTAMGFICVHAFRSRPDPAVVEAEFKEMDRLRDQFLPVLAQASIRGVVTDNEQLVQRYPRIDIRHKIRVRYDTPPTLPEAPNPVYDSPGASSCYWYLGPEQGKEIGPGDSLIKEAGMQSYVIVFKATGLRDTLMPESRLFRQIPD
jgi:hypothetical protein